MTSLGSPSTQAMECLATDNPLDKAAEFIQVMLKRTWPRNQVPYLLDKTLHPLDRLVIAKAMHIIQSSTCVRFVPYQEAKHSLWVILSRNCPCSQYRKRCDFIGAFANIGPLPGGRLVISGACLHPADPRSVRLITHELLHTLGLHHHHERVDRDKHVRIHWANIRLFSLLNFKWNPFYLTDGIPYDCQSIMHYREDAFAVSPNLVTMSARNPATCDLTCPSYRPREADIRLVRNKYGCAEQQQYKHKYKYTKP